LNAYYGVGLFGLQNVFSAVLQPFYLTWLVYTV
jgi:hypothetical protein